MKKLLMLGTFDPAFGRNRQLLRLAEYSGFTVKSKAYRLWGTDKVKAASGNQIVTAGRAVFVYVRIVAYMLAVGLVPGKRPHVIVVPHPSQIDAIIIGALARVLRIPVTIDYFVSLHETVVSDRALASSASVKSRLLKLIDAWSTKLATSVIADTPEDAEAFANITNTSRDKWHVVRVGADPAHFHPIATESVEPESVLFYGTYIPLQGIEYIVRASVLLPRDYTIRFIGNGQLRRDIEILIADLNAPIHLLNQIPEHELAHHIARAQVCLGIFGDGMKTQRVIPNKVYQCLAVGRPVITGDSPAIQVLKDCVVTVPVANPQAIADAITDLMTNADKREKLATAGHQKFVNEFTDERLAQDFARAAFLKK